MRAGTFLSLARKSALPKQFMDADYYVDHVYPFVLFLADL